MFNTTSAYLRLIAVFLLLATSAFAFQNPPDAYQPPDKQDPFAKQLDQYPGLLNAFAHLREKMSQDVKFPPLRSKSRLLPLVPASAMFYVSAPNYGDALQQAHHILQQELESNEDFRAWWQKSAMFGAPGEFDEAVHSIVQVSEYLGDEIVVATMFREGHDSTIFMAEVRKPGLAPLLQQLNKKYSGKSRGTIRILTPEQLASPGTAPKDAAWVLVRPDFVIVAEKLADLKSLNSRLNGKAGSEDQFEGTPFGQRIAQSYQAGVGMLAAVDLSTLMTQSTDARKDFSALKQTGFDDLKYVVAEHKENQGEGSSSVDLAFAGPRRGAASWLGSPGPLGGMDFFAPDTTMALDLHLKDLSQVLDDVQLLVDPANRGFTANLEMIQKQFNINLRQDLLGKLTGEIAIAFDPPSGGDALPALRVILAVRDADVLQQTLKQAFTLLGGTSPDAGEPAVEQSTEGGIIYYSARPPGQPKARLHYAFVDNYLVLGMSRALVRDAVRFHRSGRSLAHSADFQAALPRENNGNASAALFQDYSRFLNVAPGLLPEAQSQLLKIMARGGRNIGWAVAGENSIRLVASGGGPDITTIAMVAALAIPNVMRGRAAANETSAASTIRTVITKQIVYATSYPDKGYARSLAVLGGGAPCPKPASARHACLLDAPLGNAGCVAGAWCERDGFRFSMSAEGCQSGPCMDFVVTATPANDKAGNQNLCATADGVSRKRSGPPLSKPISADECMKWAPL